MTNNEEERLGVDLEAISTQLENLNTLARVIYQIDRLNGWQTVSMKDFGTPSGQKFIASKLMVMVGEISKGMEWLRQMGKEGWLINGKIMTEQEINNKFLHSTEPKITEYQDSAGIIHDMHRNGEFKKDFVHSLKQMDINSTVEKFNEEMADIIIRVLGLCGSTGLDIHEAVMSKLYTIMKRGELHGGKNL